MKAKSSHSKQTSKQTSSANKPRKPLSLLAPKRGSSSAKKVTKIVPKELDAHSPSSRLFSPLLKLEKKKVVKKILPHLSVELDLKHKNTRTWILSDNDDDGDDDDHGNATDGENSHLDAAKRVIPSTKDISHSPNIPLTLLPPPKKNDPKSKAVADVSVSLTRPVLNLIPTKQSTLDAFLGVKPVVKHISKAVKEDAPIKDMKGKGKKRRGASLSERRKHSNANSSSTSSSSSRDSDLESVFVPPKRTSPSPPPPPKKKPKLGSSSNVPVSLQHKVVETIKKVKKKSVKENTIVEKEGIKDKKSTDGRLGVKDPSTRVMMIPMIQEEQQSLGEQRDHWILDENGDGDGRESMMGAKGGVEWTHDGGDDSCSRRGHIHQQHQKEGNEDDSGGVNSEADEFIHDNHEPTQYFGGEYQTREQAWEQQQHPCQYEDDAQQIEEYEEELYPRLTERQAVGGNSPRLYQYCKNIYSQHQQQTTVNDTLEDIEDDQEFLAVVDDNDSLGYDANLNHQHRYEHYQQQEQQQYHRQQHLQFYNKSDCNNQQPPRHLNDDIYQEGGEVMYHEDEVDDDLLSFEKEVHNRNLSMISEIQGTPRNCVIDDENENIALGGVNDDGDGLFERLDPRKWRYDAALESRKFENQQLQQNPQETNPEMSDGGGFDVNDGVVYVQLSSFG
ncbi:UNVERIFIED_CONTAM: hypothetical protein HDU68_009181 [Siphonaria sp. JEL0065]|nr:hypothetical protein HDU68_009181 [Siphonaria sp. JEL0065]